MLMVQTNAPPMKSSKIKGPPPVPPRPNQSVVAEALAKTRKAVAESKVNFTKNRAFSRQDTTNTHKVKTLDRSNTSNASVSPKQNGLARVKSFIRDVISDRSSSSDERKSSGQNSRRSSSDSNSIPAPASTKKSNESLNSKAVKTCRQILVRSLSTSNKLDQDSKSKVIKSSSFAEKTFPLRKAPPPPLSPKPKLKPMKPLPVQKRQAPSSPTSPTVCSTPKKSPQVSPYSSPELSPYSFPIDTKPPQYPPPEAPYASVEEVQDFDDRLRNSPTKEINNKTEPQSDPVDVVPKPHEDVNKNTSSLERKTSRVTEMLISEILASRNNNNKDEANTVIDKGKVSENTSNANESPEVEMMKDMNNHEMLIYELQSMHSQSNVPNALEIKECDDTNGLDSEEEPNYAVSSNDTDEAYEQAYAYIVDDDLKSRYAFLALNTSLVSFVPRSSRAGSFKGLRSNLTGLCTFVRLVVRWHITNSGSRVLTININ